MAEDAVALYDQHTELRAWWVGDHIFSLDLEWLAFIHDNNAFTAQVNSTWLGPAHDGLLLDEYGHVVLWAADARVQGDVAPYKPPPAPRPPRPERPYRPNLPPRPYRPPRPSDGWSRHEFDAWVRPQVLQHRQDDAVAGQNPNEISFDGEETSDS